MSTEEKKENNGTAESLAGLSITERKNLLVSQLELKAKKKKNVLTYGDVADLLAVSYTHLWEEGLP